MTGSAGKPRVVRQRDLTSECWLIQLMGKEACETCEHRDTKDCGGKKIRKTGRNSKGIAAPVPDYEGGG